MQTTDIATRLAELYRKGEFATAHAELFARDAISIEPEGAPGEVVAGVSAIRKSGHSCPNAVERVHRIDVDEPLVAGDYFSVSMSLDSTVVGRGRVEVDELCVYYLVDGGKIVSERFFYTFGN